MLVSTCVVFVLHIYCCLGFNILISEGFIWLELSNDGPAILDSTIKFFATLKGDSLKDNYRYKFQDSRHSEDKICGINCTYYMNVTRPPYRPDNFTMKVYVFDVDTVYKEEVASNETIFRVTELINGHIEISMDGNVRFDNYIPSGKPVNMTSCIYDPNDFFGKASMFYLWNINDDIQVAGKLLEHSFPKTGKYKISLTVVAEFPEPSKQENKWGFFERDLTAQDQIPRINISGNAWISHGKMLNLYATCNGSSPFLYCWKIYPGDKPAANFTCDYPLPSDSCNFTISSYIAAIGQYYLSVLVKNDVSMATRSLDIRILDTSHVPQLSVTIIPITCAILAIIIVVTGVAYYCHQRKRYCIEVADFDFTRSELVEMTFFERIFVAIRNALTNARLPRRNSTNYERLRNSYGAVG